MINYGTSQTHDLRLKRTVNILWSPHIIVIIHESNNSDMQQQCLRSILQNWFKSLRDNAYETFIVSENLFLQHSGSTIYIDLLHKTIYIQVLGVEKYWPIFYMENIFLRFMFFIFFMKYIKVTIYQIYLIIV